MNVSVDMQDEESLGFQSELQHRYLTFNIDNQFYAFPIIDVREIIKVEKISKVPEFPAYAKGIINIRGDIVPIIDVRLRFNMQEAEYNSKTCIIIVNSGNIEIGFIVDEVQEVIDITDDNISPAPKIATRGGKYIKGIGRAEGNIIILLDSHLLISDEDQSVFEDYIKE